jgi:hypothetical protein
MRDLRKLNSYRIAVDIAPLYGDENSHDGGVFVVPHRGTKLRVIAGNGDGWDHLSVSVKNRCPTWEEMEHIKRLFFEPHELAWEYHMPESDHISIHPYTLHIWRKHDFEMPTPPKIMV